MNAFFELMKNKSLFYPFSNQILEDIKTNVNNKQDMNKMEDLIDSIGPVAYQGFPSYPLEEEKEDEEEITIDHRQHDTRSEVWILVLKLQDKIYNFCVKRRRLYFDGPNIFYVTLYENEKKLVDYYQQTEYFISLKNDDLKFEYKDNYVFPCYLNDIKIDNNGGFFSYSKNKYGLEVSRGEEIGNGYYIHEWEYGIYPPSLPTSFFHRSIYLLNHKDYANNLLIYLGSEIFFSIPCSNRTQSIQDVHLYKKGLLKKSKITNFLLKEEGSDKIILSYKNKENVEINETFSFVSPNLYKSDNSMIFYEKNLSANELAAKISSRTPETQTDAFVSVLLWMIPILLFGVTVFLIVYLVILSYRDKTRKYTSVFN
jgi:hypothetical protein